MSAPPSFWAEPKTARKSKEKVRVALNNMVLVCRVWYSVKISVNDHFQFASSVLYLSTCISMQCTIH